MSDRRAYEQEWENQPGYSAPAPLADSLSSTRTIPANKDTGKAYPIYDGIVGGKIIESMGYLHTYRVAIDNGPIIQCTDLRHKSVLPLGPSDISMYSSGDEVLVLLQSSITYGIILGAVTPPVQEPLDYRPDVIHAGSNVGYFVDGTCNYWADLASNDMIDFSAGRPVDATAGPESGQQGLTGLGFFHDDFMVMMKVDEATGIFGFYDDSLLRVTGRNLQIRASGLEYEHLNDEGEISSYRGITPYPWEASGTFKPGVQAAGDVLDVTTTEEPTTSEEPDNPELGDDETTTEEPGSTTTESPPESPEIEGIRHGFRQPMAYDQMPFHRNVQFEGYLGQGGRDSVLVPGPDVAGHEDTLINTYSEDLRLMSLLATQKSLTGALTMVSSGGFLFVKRPPLPAPKRRERPESPLGDLNTAVATYRKNYDACGLPEEEEATTTEEPDDGEPTTTEEPTTQAPYVAHSTHKVVAEIPFEDATTADPNAPTTEEPSSTEEPTTVEGETTTIDPASLTRESIPEEVVRLAMVADEVAYSLAWEGLHTFHYHSKDYYLPQESDLEEFNRSPAAEYASLAKYQYLGEDPESLYPEKVSVRVDHRYGEVNIYLNTAMFGLRKDGSIIMQSGCGCGFSTLGGNLELTAPADIVIRPGRNFINLSGHDTIIKARNSVDLSATENDIRMVAWGNLMAASAVGGTGAMLFQSFSTCVIDPEKSNLVDGPTSTSEPDGSTTEEPTTEAPDEPTKAPTYFLGEEVIGSGILFKSSRAQITISSKEANIEVGRKVYEDEGEEGENDPAPVNEDGVIEERKWRWEPGRIRLSADSGDIELFGTYIVNYICAPGGFTNEGAGDDSETSSGSFMQVFIRRQQLQTDEDTAPPLEPNDLPPNILAAAGTADLSGNNSCSEAETLVCYTVASVNEFRADRANFCSQVLINTELFVGGCAYIRGNLVTFDHVESNYKVEQFNGSLFTQRSDVVDTFDEADTRCRQLLPPMTAELVNKFVSAVSGAWLDYSCRTPEQYGTSQAFCIMETHWQHQIRIAAEAEAIANPDPDNPPPPEGAEEHTFNFFPDLPEGLVYWSEMYTTVDYANKQKTAPYPGIDYVHYEETTTEEPPTTTTEEPVDGEEPTTTPAPDENPPRLAKRGYGVYTLSLVDEVEGRPIDRDSTYEPTTLEGDEEPPEQGAAVYESPTLKRSVKRELSHYIAVDVLSPTTTTTTTTEAPEE